MILLQLCVRSELWPVCSESAWVILASAVLVSRQALINVNILLSDFLEYNAKQIGDTDEIDNEE